MTVSKSKPAGPARTPWIIRTYAGFGDAVETNARFRENLERGQRGLSVAFDLPTQCGYDPDDRMARGDVGQTGVSVAHLGDMRALFDGIDLATANTSMTINATAPWLYALYLALADERGVPREVLRGTTQNDLLKEFVARGTSIFDPDASLRLSTDLIVASIARSPRWNPTNCCGYHLMESGALPAEEVGFTFANALFVLDAVRPRLSVEGFSQVVDAISFFINSGIELVAEIAKVRAYSQLWPALCRERYGLEPRFRAGCQVRSLTLTAQQPEVNIVRIALQALPVLLSASARVGALQLPGFREALGLPDEGEQWLSLRTQQVLMAETDIAQHEDIFAGSHVIEAATAAVVSQARDIIEASLARGYRGTIEHLSALLGRRMAEWKRAVDGGERPLVGVNCHTEAVPVSLPARPAMPTPPAEMEERLTQSLASWRADRDSGDWVAARAALVAAAEAGESVIEPSVVFARAGGTTGEWTAALLEVFGARWSAPLGVGSVGGERAAATNVRSHSAGPTPRVLLAKAGLDGHVNALRVLALSLRQAGAEVVYLGLGQSPEAVAAAAVAEDVDVIGISSLSGGHLAMVRAVRAALIVRGGADIPIAIGGILPHADRALVLQAGAAAVFTADDGSLDDVVAGLIAVANRRV